MKKLTLSVATLLIASIVFISSCSKSGTGSSGTGTFTFTANGTVTTYPSSTGLVTYTGASLIQGVGTDASNSSNTLIFRYGSSSSGTSTFNSITVIELTKNNTLYYSYNAASTPSPGSVTVNISGTTATASFNTILYNSANSSDSIIITNGSYSGKYSVQ